MVVTPLHPTGHVLSMLKFKQFIPRTTIFFLSIELHFSTKLFSIHVPEIITCLHEILISNRKKIAQKALSFPIGL